MFQHGGHITKDLYGSSPGVLGGVSVATLVNAYLDSIGSWVLDVRFDEESGNLINHGTDGNSAGNANVTQGVNGQLGRGEAYDYNGTDSRSTFANADVPGCAALTAWRWVGLFKVDTVGESCLLTFGHFGDAGWRYIAINAVGRIIARVDTASGTATVGSPAGTMIADKWVLVFVDFDNANILGNGRILRIIYSDAGAAPTELAASPVAAADTIVVSSGDLAIGEFTNGGYDMDGQIDFERWGGDSLWSPAGQPLNLDVPTALWNLVFP